MQILTSNLVSVHNPDIPAHSLVLADRSLLSTVRYPLLAACIWDTSQNPLLANASSPLFSCISLLSASWSVIAAYCSLLATRLMVLLASRSLTYAAPGILLLIACSEDISYSPFAARCLLYASPFMLLTTCYSLLPLCCFLAVCLLLDSCFSLLGPLLSRCSPVTVNRTFAQCLLHANCYYMLTAHDSPFAFFCFRFVLDKS